jgi:hypothetical protein
MLLASTPEEGATMLRLPPAGTAIPATRAFLVTLPPIMKATNAVPISSAPTVIHRAEPGRARHMLPRSPLFRPENISALNKGAADRAGFDSVLKRYLRNKLCNNGYSSCRTVFMPRFYKFTISDFPRLGEEVKIFVSFFLSEHDQVFAKTEIHAMTAIRDLLFVK